MWPTSTWRRWARSWVCSLLLLPATAAASDVLVYGPHGPDSESERRTRALHRTARAGEPLGLVHVLDLPFPSQEPVWMAGDLTELPCPDPQLRAFDPAAALSEGVARIDELDHAAGLLALERAQRALPCTELPVSRETLASLRFYEGLAHFVLGDRAAAKRAFTQAQAVDPGRPWNRDYPPEPERLWVTVGKRLTEGGPVDVDIDLRGGGLKHVTVDGEPLDGEVLRLPLLPGRHVVHYVDAEGGVHGRLVDVRGKGALVTRAALQDVVLRLDEGGIGAVAARLALQQLAVSRSADRVAVVILGPPDRGFSFAPSTRAVAGLGRSRAGARIQTERLSLTANGGLQLVGPLPYALVALRLDLRLVRGLELEGAVQSAFRPHRDSGDRAWTVVLPMFGGGLRYRREQGALRPYAGGRGLVGFGHAEDFRGTAPTLGVLGAGLGVVGLDVVPSGTRGFVLNVDVAAGATSTALGDPAFVLTVGAGVGVRL